MYPAAVLDVNCFLAGMEVSPGSIVLEHCVENHQELSHASGDDDFRFPACEGMTDIPGPLAPGQFTAAKGKRGNQSRERDQSATLF